MKLIDLGGKHEVVQLIQMYNKMLRGRLVTPEANMTSKRTKFVWKVLLYCDYKQSELLTSGDVTTRKMQVKYTNSDNL
jgi:hypothetical protein